MKANNHLACCICWALSLGLLAVATTARANPLTETQQDTISRALKELQSPSPEQRYAAVQLLAKYPQDPKAQGALLKAIDDPHPKVRLVAISLILEAPSYLSVLEKQRTLAAIKYIGDAEVPIRRASSLVAFQRLRFSSSQNPLEFSEETREDLRKAYFDTDVVVRRHMIQIDPKKLKLQLSEADWVRLLKDKDPKVLTHAIALASSELSETLLLQAAQYIAETSTAPTVLLALLPTLKNLKDPNVIAVLEKLAEDTKPQVRLEAKLKLLSANKDENKISEILKLIDSKNIPSASKYRAISEISRQKKAIEYLRQLAQSELPSVRQIAIQRLLWLPKFKDRQWVYQLLEDSDKKIRLLAKTYFNSTSRWHLPSEGFLKPLLTSEYEEIRSFVLSKTSTLPRKKAIEWTEELLLDPSAQVRQVALSTFIQNRYDGWEQILEISLEDNSIAIRESSWRTIQAMGSRAEAILVQYLKNNPKGTLAPRAQSQLRRLRISKNNNRSPLPNNTRNPFPNNKRTPPPDIKRTPLPRIKPR